MDYATLRLEHAATVSRLMPEVLAPLDAPREEVLGLQQARLRALVRHAKERSPFHRARLAHVDPETCTLQDLPTMTRADMMGNFDDLVTDSRLSLDRVNEHLAGLAGDRYLLDRYHAVMSSGSSGLRGVFLYDWDGWALNYLGYVRTIVRLRRRQKRDPQDVSGVIGAQNAAHSSVALAQTFSRSQRMRMFPVTMPLEEMVQGLNDLQPTVLQGYPSALHLLAREALDGRLRIDPGDLCVSAEPLLPEIRARLAAAWPEAPIWNAWGTSEAGAMAVSCGHAPGMHLSEDLTIVEPVDREGRPVPPGTRSAKVFVTNLYNRVFPLIRYEVTDEVTVDPTPCPCGSHLLRVEDIQGRLEEWFRYGDHRVHPVIFRDPLGLEPNVAEYQVAQTARGAHVKVRCAGEVDLRALEVRIETELMGLGLAHPEVTLEPVPALPRGDTGKIRRFIPLEG